MKHTALGILAIAAMFLVISPTIALAQTNVYRFSDEPFDFTRCYKTTDWIPGPAAEFGQNVCVHYQALNSETVRIKINKDGSTDLGWNLIQQGTATITSQSSGEVLYIGPFQVEEIAQDDGNDAGCVWTDGQHAWGGLCSGFYSTLDYLTYQWKITGNSVYFFKVTIRGPGNYCYDAKGVQYGPGCKIP